MLIVVISFVQIIIGYMFESGKLGLSNDLKSLVSQEVHEAYRLQGF